jgi:hypothetical protein
MEKLQDHDECPSDTAAASHEELIRLGKLQQCPRLPRGGRVEKSAQSQHVRYPSITKGTFLT